MKESDDYKLALFRSRASYKLGIRDERERVRKLLNGCLLDARDGHADEDTEVDEREEHQMRSNAVQDSLEEILMVLDNWKPNENR